MGCASYRSQEEVGALMARGWRPSRHAFIPLTDAFIAWMVDLKPTKPYEEVGIQG